jgi:KDO2-lipid IV(A) lauroyltransferase
MTAPSAPGSRCGIDTVEIARIERFLRETPPEDLARLYSAQELRDAGEGPGRAASLAARFAAKEACLKLFPRETAFGRLAPADFSVERDAYGAPRVVLGAAAEVVAGVHRIGSISVSLSHDRTSASAVAFAVPAVTPVPWLGWLVYHLLPLRRRVIVENLNRVYGASVGAGEIRRLAQAHYGHLARILGEFALYPMIPPSRRLKMARVENLEALTTALAQGRGAIVLTGHFGNFEVATAAAIARFPEARGRFFFIRRPMKPDWVDAYVVHRFRRAGFEVLQKSQSLDTLLDRMAAGDIVVVPFDQHAGPRDGVRVDFFGHPAGTFKSLAIIAQSTGAPVLPAACWRGEDGVHVLRFEEPLALEQRANVGEEIRCNTGLFNAALERLVVRHPEQWWWVHRRWKEWPARRWRPKAGA